MQIKKTIEKVPGGLMVVPLLLGAVTNTFFPNSPKFLGGFTGSFMTGTGALLFVFFFALGTGLDIRTTGRIARKGLTILFGKVILGAVLGIVASMFLPISGVQAGLFSGLSVLAIVASFNAANGGLLVALLTPLNRKIDIASYPFFSIQSGPFFTLLTLGVAGLGAFPWQALVSTLIPYILGIILGSLDPEFRKMFAPVSGALVPFFAFTIGFSINLAMIVKSGFTGIVMGIAVVFISGIFMWACDRFIGGGDGVLGWAASSTAGAAVTVPATIAALDPAYRIVGESATAIVATSVVVSAILTPIVTMWYYKRVQHAGRLEHQDTSFDVNNEMEMKNAEQNDNLVVKEVIGNN